MELLTVILVCTLVYVIWKYMIRKNDRFPPGPLVNFPVLGHLPYLGERPWETCLKWRSKYGDVIGINFGSYRCVILNDHRHIKEVFAMPVFTGRPDLPALNLSSAGKHGIVSAEGDVWVEQRRFTLRHLRDFGFGKKSLERVIHDEVAELIEGLSKDKANPIDLNHRFNLAILNVLWQIISGDRIPQSDPKLNELLKELKEGLQSLAGLGVAVFVPWLADIAPGFFGWKQFTQTTEKARRFYMGKILQHEQTLQIHEPRDFMDVYLSEIKKTTDKDSSFYENKGLNNLLAIVSGLFVAGSETTALTLTWVALYLGVHPDVQKKLHEEIDEIVGKTRLPSLDDRPKMPYTEAVINETFRLSSVNQLGGPHTALADTEFERYKIPKGTVIFPNVWGVHHDPRVWGDAENFRPERFLSPDGTKCLKNEALLTFSTGKRNCIGEPLARDELFIFMTSIYQKFEVNLDPNQPKPSLNPILSVLSTPESFKVVLKERF